MTDKITESIFEFKKRKPIIHCITNPISINQCANAIISIGGRPVMAEHPGEVYEITSSCDALMLNLGNITDVRMISMLISLEKARDMNIPVLLDIVGVACSRLRRDYVLELLKTGIPSVIKGNYSEIAALENPDYHSAGVDADISLDVSAMSGCAKKLAQKYDTVIMASGRTDIITDGKRMIYANNGVCAMAEVTGSGCMLGALTAVFLTQLLPADAAVAACVYFGICGELAVTDKGNGSYMVNLMNKISTLCSKEILKYADLEEI